MTMQNDDLLPARSGQLFQSFAEVNFLRDKQFLAESIQFPERPCLTKNERTRHPVLPSANTIPNPNKPDCPANRFIQCYGRATTNTAAALNVRRHFCEQFGAWKRISVHKNQPLPVSCRGSCVPRPGDLVCGFKNDAGALRSGEFTGSIRGVIVADDDLMLPSRLGKGGCRSSNALQRTLNELFFVESWDDD